MEVLYSVLIEFGVSIKLVRLIKMCLNKTYSKIYITENLSDKFPIQIGLKHADIYNFVLEYAIGKVQENQEKLN
jgi:hypothetical protein